MAAPIHDEKYQVLHNRTYFGKVKNVAGYHPGPVMPFVAYGTSSNWGSFFHYFWIGGKYYSNSITKIN